MKNWQTFSIRSNSRTVKVFAFLLLLTVLAALASICFGPVFVSPVLLPKILLGQLTGTTPSYKKLYYYITLFLACQELF